MTAVGCSATSHHVERFTNACNEPSIQVPPLDKRLGADGTETFLQCRRDRRPARCIILEARTDQFVLEFASREMAEIERWKEWDDGRELGAGLVDVKSFYPESPEDVAARIRSALAAISDFAPLGR